MTGEVYAIEVTGHDGSGEVTLYYSTGAGFVTAPGDTPANTPFAPRVVDPGNYSQFLIDQLVTDGRSRAGYGNVVLNNADGGLDAARDYGFDGRPLVIRLGTPGAAYPGGWTTLFTGTVEQALPEWDQLTLVLKDRTFEAADRPYQPVKYAGTNVLPDGVEGVEGDLEGKPKPVLRGKALNFAPPCVNTSKLTFQVSDREIHSLDAVYVGGVAWTPGTEHASLSALQSASLSGTTYDAYLGAAGSGAFFRLGSSPAATVTCDATAGATAADRTAAQLAVQILEDAGIAGGDIDADSADALDALNPAVIGIWTGVEETTAGEALDAVLGSVGGYWAVGGDGVFYLGRLGAPSGTPVRTLYGYEILAGDQPVETLRGRADDRGVPAWRVVLGYQKNYTVQADSDLAPAVTDARRGFLKQEFRTVVAEDSAVQTQYLLAAEKTVDTLLDAAADAADEADRQQTLYGVVRRFHQVRVSASYLRGTAVRLGDVWALDLARYDWSGGKSFILVGFTHSYRDDETTLQLWG